MIYTGPINDFLRLEEVTAENCVYLKEKKTDSLCAFWCKKELEILVDGVLYNFKKNEIVFLTEFHTVDVKSIENVRLIRFNRAFYCISDHDSEVGCRGILFFGASQLPFISIPDLDLEKFEILWKMFVMEMQSKDDLQKDMLEMMLKRFLILCARLYKEQANLVFFDNQKLDIIRSYNYLVETHFKQIHQVTEYAAMLHKSPKTLSNLFKKYGDKTPLQVIQDRILLEARRLLRFSDKSVKEIAYELGYEDLQTFSRFFRNSEGISPTEYRNMEL